MRYVSPARTTTTGTLRARAAPRAAAWSGDADAAARPASTTLPTRSCRSTSAAPPTWSRCGWVRTMAVTDRIPARRSWRATSASGGPWSTSTAPPGTSSSTESPCPTSRNVTRSPRGASQAGLGISAHPAAPRQSTLESSAAIQPLRRYRGARRTSQTAAIAPPTIASATGDSTCADGQAATSSRDERDPPGAPTGEPGQRGRCTGEDGLDRRGGEGEPDQRRHRGLGGDVRRDRPERDRAEVEPDDGRGDDTARDRHHEDVPRLARHGVPLGDARGTRQRDEDRRDGRERQLKPGLEPRGRHPRQQHQRADGERVPAVARAGDDPGERSEHAGDRRPHDRRLPSDRERVREHHDDRDALADEPPDTGDARDGHDADRRDRDVLARHGEQVHQPARLECVAERAVDAAVLAEHDAGE